MINKFEIKKSILMIVILCFFSVAAFSSIYAMETDTNDESQSMTETEQVFETLSELEGENVVLDLEIIGDGIVEIMDNNENTISIIDEESREQISCSKGSELLIKAAVKDEDSIIYGIYAKNADGQPSREEIEGKGLLHEKNVTMSEDVRIRIVFAKVDEKEIVLDDFFDYSNGYDLQPLAIGDVGQNWGMYSLFTNYTLISELGSGATYAYGHIIQVDTNYDKVYEDVTYTGYCIEYGKECPSGGYLTETELSVAQKDYLGYALAYGWRQKETTYVESIYKDTYARSEIAVTQGIIWCCTKNIFNTTSGESAMTKIINGTHQPEHARAYYNKLKETILNIDKKPSFDGKSLVLEWNDTNKRYETTINDTNGMLEAYTYAYTGITFEKKGDTLTIYTKNTYPNGVLAKAKRVVYGGENSVRTWDGRNGKQDMATYTETSREILSTITLKTKTKNGTVKLIKASSLPEITNDNTYYSLEGAVYGIYSNKECTNLVNKLVTDVDGTTKGLSLAEGTYYVKEITPSKGFLIDTDVYKVIVTSEKETVLSVEEIPIAGNIVLKKTILKNDINFDNGNPMFLFKLIGEYPNGSTRVLYRIVDFTKEYVEKNTDEKGYVHLSVKFDDLYAGMYSAIEMETSRYKLNEISNVINGQIVGTKVQFELDTDADMKGEAQFININYEQQNYSDSSKVINELKF